MNWRSLKARIIIGMAGCVIAVTIAGGVVMYALFRDHMMKQEDRALESKLALLRLWAVQKGRFVGFKVEQGWWHRVNDENEPEYFQFRYTNDRRNLLRSLNLAEDEDLPLIGIDGSEIVFEDFTLPSGKPARGVGYSFFPKDKEGEAAKAIPVHVILAHDTSDMHDALSRLRWVIFAVNVIAVGVIVGVAYSIVRHILRPLSDLSNQIANVPLRVRGYRFELTGAADEVTPVVNRLNALMERVEGAIENERQFTTNAAHELRNPIAAIRAQLEYALKEERSGEDYRELIGAALDVEKGVQHTVENLLLLARLETGNETIQTGETDVPALLRRAWRPLFERAEGKELRVSWNCAKDMPKIEFASALLEIVLRNLFENAVDYTERNGKIEISALVDTERDELSVSVVNGPAELNPEDVKNIFRRFWRAPGRKDAGHAHSGIGLSLCQRIADALAGSIEAEIGADRSLTIRFRAPSGGLSRKDR